jgi:hypothetical protein
MGNLFSRQQPIDVLTRLRFAELREWNIWHELMAKEELKATEKLEDKHA